MLETGNLFFQSGAVKDVTVYQELGVQPGRPGGGAVEQSPPWEGGLHREGGVGQDRRTSAVATSRPHVQHAPWEE